MSSFLQTVEILILNSVVQTVLWVIVFSSLVGLVEVYRQPSVNLTACCNPAVGIYLTMLVVGNSILAVLVAFGSSRIPMSSVQGWWMPFFAAVLSTFGAELLRRQAKIKWLLKDILRREEQARTKAVKVTRNRQIRINARKLGKRVELDLGPWLGELRSKRPELAARIDATAGQRSQQAFVLASERTDLGEGILAPLARSWRWRWVAGAVLLVGCLIYIYAALVDLQVKMLRRTKVSGHFEHIEARKLIGKLASKAVKGRAVIDVASNPTIDSFEAKDETLETVMDRLCTICDCEWTLEAGHPPTLWVSHRTKGAQPTLVRGRAAAP
jgi:hypothetical protein